MAEAKNIDLQTIMLPILALTAGSAFFYYASPILIPLIIAAALTYILLPLVEILKRIKVPHAPAVIIVMLAALGVIILIGFLLISQIADLASALPQYANKIDQVMKRLQASLSDYTKILPGDLKNPEAFSIDLGQVQKISGYFFKGLGSVTSFLGSSLLLFFLTLFMLLDSEIFQKKLKSIFGMRQAETTEGILQEINHQLKGFIRIKFIVAVALAIVVTIGLLIFDVKYAYIWGPLVGIMNLIPFVGSIVSSIPPIIVSGIQHNSTLYMVYVAIFFLVVQFIEGNIVTPRLTSGSVDLNTSAILISVMYWGWLWGFIGIILAVPITAAVKIVCDHVESLKPIGIMLGTGREG